MKRFRNLPIDTAVVTGAASGIGAAEVARLRARGVRVVAADLSATIESMYAEDPGVVGLVADVTDTAAAAELVRRAEEAFGPVDLLFHSAGIMPGGRIADTSSEKALRVMSVNYGGTVTVIEAVLPGMKARRRGQIVVLGSLTGYVPSEGFSAYSASKSAVDAYVEILAHEERANGIQVLLAAPNAVKTPLLSQAVGGPKLVTALADKDSSPMLSTTDGVLDVIERGLAKEKVIVTPGGTAIHLIRRLFPSVTWVLAKRLGI